MQGANKCSQRKANTWCQLLGDLLPSSEVIPNSALPYNGALSQLEDMVDWLCPACIPSGRHQMWLIYWAASGSDSSGGPLFDALPQADKEPVRDQIGLGSVEPTPDRRSIRQVEVSAEHNRQMRVLSQYYDSTYLCWCRNSLRFKFIRNFCHLAWACDDFWYSWWGRVRHLAIWESRGNQANSQNHHADSTSFDPIDPGQHGNESEHQD